jgi:hypothetical protein
MPATKKATASKKSAKIVEETSVSPTRVSRRTASTQIAKASPSPSPAPKAPKKKGIKII